MNEENQKQGSKLKTFLIILTTFIITVVLVLGGLGLYIYKANPFNVQACLISSFLNSAGGEIRDNNPVSPDGSASAESGVNEQDKHPLLNEDQEKQLEEAGIDVESLPQTISPEAEECFIEKLGEERVKEIKEGDSPSSYEIFKTRSCL